jgi:hypothetical protein
MQRDVNRRELLRQRLVNLGIAVAAHASAADAVSALGAMQAQDYAGGLWAIGLRMRHGTLEAAEGALSDRTVVRTWLLRGTLHFVAAADVHWLLDLLAPRAIAGAAKRHRDLELDAPIFRKAERALTKALEGGRQLTRDGVRRAFEGAKLKLEGQQLYHCLWQLAQEKLLCYGLNEGKQPTYRLLSEWVPDPRHKLTTEDALAQLARRYFSSHGPASLQDLMRWADINAREAKLGVAGTADSLVAEEFDGVTYWRARDPQPSAAGKQLFLLPGFDEYVLGYKDRSQFLPAEHANKIVPGGNGVFRPTIVYDGEVIGTWKATPRKGGLLVEPSPFARIAPAQSKLFVRAAADYARFLGLTLAET